MPIQFFEVGHFYTDESNEHIDLTYLEQLCDKIKQFGKSLSIFSLFIDDYNQDSNVLDVQVLHKKTESILGVPVVVFYEKDMIQYFNQTLSLLTDSDLVVTKYNRGKKEKLELALGDTRITLAEIYPTFKPTCAMLSLTWSLFRLGVFDDNCNDIFTIIDKKYEPVERKVQLMLDYISTRKYIPSNSINYWFYQS